MMLGIHLLWMLVRYFLAFPVWGDEAFVINNLPDAGYGDLIAPLPNGQVGPLLWWWLEKACYDLGQGSLQVLRLPALVAGIVSTWLMLRFCLKALPQPSALLAFAVFCASYYPLRHAVEVKPYAIDLLWALIQLNLALDLIRKDGVAKRGKAMALVVFSCIGVWLSYPSLFTSAGLGLFFFCRRGSRGPALGASLLFGGVAAWMVFSYALPHARAASWLMEMDMWKPAFPPFAQWWALPYWFLERHCGYMAAYPTGGRDFGSSASFLLMFVGAVGLVRAHQGRFLLLLMSPLLFNFLAASMQQYPYGGSIRVSIFLAPASCLLMGHGLACALGKLREPAASRVGVAVVVLLFGFATSGLVRDVQQPFKTDGDVAAREFSAWFGGMVQPGEAVAGYCNQREGAPDFHGLGGSMARLRVQLRAHGVEPDWTALSQPEPTGALWWLVYTDDNDRTMKSVMPQVQSLHYGQASWQGYTIEHIPFPFDKAERVDVYRLIRE